MPAPASSRPVGSVIYVTGLVVLALIGAFAHGSSQPPAAPSSGTDRVQQPATALVMQDGDLPANWQYTDIQGNTSRAERHATFTDTDIGTSYRIRNTVHVYDSVEAARAAYEEQVAAVEQDGHYTLVARTAGDERSFGDASFAYRPPQTYTRYTVHVHDDNVYYMLRLDISGSIIVPREDTLFTAAKALDQKI